MSGSNFLSSKSSDIEPDESRGQKLKFLKFKMADGGHLENRFFGHHTSTTCPISA